MDVDAWLEDWKAYFAAKEAELRDLDAWIAAKMPKKQRGRKTYETVSGDPLLLSLLDQRILIRKELAAAKKYVARKEAA